jgi:hypothetical protein
MPTTGRGRFHLIARRASRFWAVEGYSCPTRYREGLPTIAGVMLLLLRLATAKRIGADDLSASRLKQFAQLVQVLSAGIPDHEVAKAVVAPGLYFKRQGGPHRLIPACVSRSPILENED